MKCVLLIACLFCAWSVLAQVPPLPPKKARGLIVVGGTNYTVAWDAPTNWDAFTLNSWTNGGKTNHTMTTGLNARTVTARRGQTVTANVTGVQGTNTGTSTNLVINPPVQRVWRISGFQLTATSLKGPWTRSAAATYQWTNVAPGAAKFYASTNRVKPVMTNWVQL